MLSLEQIQENKIAYLKLLSTLHIDLSNIINYLESQRADFFNKPYSIYPDGAYAGALCEHSLKLYSELKHLCSMYAQNRYSEEDIIKVSLFVGFYKCELYELYFKNQKNEITGNWESVAAYRVKEARPTFGDVGLSSYLIAKKFIDLTDEQTMSIIYATNDSFIDSHLIKKMFPLVSLTQMAEKAVNFLK